MAFQLDVDIDLTDENFTLYLSPDEDDGLSESIPMNLQMTKAEAHENTEVKEWPNKKKTDKKNPKKETKKPTLKILLTKFRKCKTKLKKGEKENLEIKNLHIKEVGTQKTKQIETRAGSKRKLDEILVSDNERHPRKTKPAKIKSAAIPLANTKKKIPEVVDPKKNQNRLKLDRPKRNENILKPIAKKIKLRVGNNSSVAVVVPESEKIKNIEAPQVKILRKSSRSKLVVPKTGKSKDNGSILVQDHDKEPATLKPSIEEKLNNGNPDSSSMGKTQMLNEVRERLKGKLGKTLTYKELEEMCMQKICEAIYHESEIGELRHQLNMQEEKSKQLRMEMQQMAEQANELKHLHEIVLLKIRSLDAMDKALVNVKSVRSVALQVKPTSFGQDK